MFLLVRDILRGLLLSHLEDGMSACSGTGLALRRHYRDYSNLWVQLTMELLCLPFTGVYSV